MQLVSNRVWPALVLLFTVVIVGCGDGEPEGGGNGAKRGGTNVATGPAPRAGGTVTDDAAQPRVSILPVPTWEEFVAENGGEELPEPRTRKEIYEDEQRLPALYLTNKTLTRVIAPGNLRVHKHRETGEVCWPASGCYNPACPGRGEDGEPFAFISRQSGAYVASNGQIAFLPPTQPSADPSPAHKDKPGGAFARDPSKLGHVCPACIEVRDLANETDADRARYARWVHPHELPETLARRRELTEERRRRIAWERAHR